MIAGVHISIISTIGIATIASTVGAGGLGTILFDGMRTQNVVKIVWGTFLSVVMVLGVNGILKLIEKTSEEETVSGMGSGEKERLMDSRGQTSLWKK